MLGARQRNPYVNRQSSLDGLFRFDYSPSAVNRTLQQSEFRRYHLFILACIRPMLLGRLFHPGRYRRCRALFQAPLRAHIQLALLRRQPLNLTLRNGKSLSIRKPRSFRPLFKRWLTSEQPHCLDTTPDGAVQFDCDGLHIALRPDSGDEYVFHEVFHQDVYKLESIQSPLDTVVDLGANIGLFSIRAVQHASRVFAVESNAENFDLARRNVEANGLEHRVTLIQAAASGTSGNLLRIYSSEMAGGHSVHQHLAARWPNGTESRVPSISLADLFEKHAIERCSLLKCDIEGSEYDVFQHAPLTVLSRVDRFVIEAHPESGDRPWRGLHDLCGKLRAAGMKINLEFTGPQTVMVEACKSAKPKLQVAA